MSHENPADGNCVACRSGAYTHADERLCSMCYTSPFRVAARAAKASKRATVIAFIGVIGSGKDYSANKLVESGGFERVDFKDGLLDLASDIVGYDVRADYEWFKEYPIGVMRPANILQEPSYQAARDVILKSHPFTMTGRRLLTRLGTEGMRKRDENYWVKQFIAAADTAVKRGNFVTTADCRFLNEIRAVQYMDPNATFIFCDYRSERYNPSLNHLSEKLAQRLLAMGLKDGEVVTEAHLTEAFSPLEPMVAK